jgi:membrane carboxypeptidase/penicillin-binding protein PbpC
VIILMNFLIGNLIRCISVALFLFKPSSLQKLQEIRNVVKESIKRKRVIPDHLVASLIKIEDRRFFHHYGIDIYGIIRASIKNIITHRVEGASTIVQQLIRNITNEREISFKRKIIEIFLATIVDSEFTKEELLFAYLDTYRFENCTGIINFCSTEDYNLDYLNLNQSAEIAARFKYPRISKTNYIKYLRRVRTIIKKTTPNTDNKVHKLVTVFANRSRLPRQIPNFLNTRTAPLTLIKFQNIMTISRSPSNSTATLV